MEISTYRKNNGKCFFYIKKQKGEKT